MLASKQEVYNSTDLQCRRILCSRSSLSTMQVQMKTARLKSRLLNKKTELGAGAMVVVGIGFIPETMGSQRTMVTDKVLVYLYLPL